MIEAIEASKSVALKAVKSKSDNISAPSSVTSKVEEVQTPTLTQAIEQKTEETEEQRTKQLQQATDELNEQMSRLNTNIAFAFSDETERLYIRVLEKDTGKLIREFPSEKARALAGYLKNAVGLLFDKES